MAQTDQEANISYEPVFVPESLIVVPLSKVQAKPEPEPYLSTTSIEEKPIILNIETVGLRPWQDRIISIGLQDPNEPAAEPTVIMLNDEKKMIELLLSIIDELEYTQMIGYGLSFDYRYILIRAMYHGLHIKQFMDIKFYDLMELMAKGKFSYVYAAQKPPSLSDLAGFLWDFPKTITDLEMIKRYLEEDYSTVLQFTKDQITRILLLYYTFNNTADVEFSSVNFNAAAAGNFLSNPNPPTNQTGAAFSNPVNTLGDIEQLPVGNHL